jgi:putative membrane protein
MNRLLTYVGLAVLLATWLGPLPGLVRDSFAAHMTMHMAVVGIGVPLLAAGLAPSVSHLPVMRSQIALPFAVSMIDLIVVWGWHAPALHHAARVWGWALALEQANFAAAALLVWLVAFGTPGGLRAQAGLSGAMTLAVTSMHMTLLGALIALSPRPLFSHGPDALADQHLGGAIMLGVGAVVYMGGALVLFARVLQAEVRS